MRKKSLVVATLAVAMIAIIAIAFVPNVLADTAASYSYPCGSGSANQVFVSSADSVKGLIQPGSAVDDNFGSGETWTFTAVPAEGYVFSSWTTSGDSYVSNLSKSSATLSFSYKNGSNGLANSDSRKFTAVANFVVKPTYTVTYNANGGSGSVPVDSNTYNAGDIVTVQGNSGLTRSGYRFIGWNTRTSYNENTEYGIGRTSYTMGSGNVTFYAQWESTTKNYDHIDIRLNGSITFDFKINGVSQPGYPKTLSITTSGASCTYVVGGNSYTVNNFTYSTSDGGEWRGTGISFRWPDSVTINATLSDGTNSYPFSHTFTGNEIYAAHIECPTDTGFDFILNANEITDQITHNVTFKTTEGGTINGGSADYTATDVPDGTSMSSIAPPAAALTGYTFEGWSPALPGTVTADGVYTARFKLITYTVAYKDISGGSLGSETVGYGHAADETPTPPAIPGKTFDHWALTGDNAAYPDDLNNVMENLVATAVYTDDIYTITYNPGASGALVGASIDTAGYNEYPDFVPGIDANLGYRFIGWSSDGGTTLLNEAGVKAIAVTGDITYTAYYEQIDYTVKYVLGTHGSTSGTTEFTKHYGDSTPAAPAVTANAGWTFTGWSPVVAATVTGDATYTAQYSQNEYTIKYDLGTHGSTTDTKEFSGKHYGDPTPTAPAVTAQAGWTFTGWLPVVSSTVTGNVTYTAQYTQDVYTVKYELGTHGTTNGTKEFTGKHYGDATPTAPVVSANAGWTFTGWLPVVSPTVTGNVTYTAQYTQNVYTVKYDLGTHGTTADTIEFTGKHYGDATPAAPTITANAGWTFTGWLPVVSATVTGDVTYVAQYTQNVYTVKYDLGTHGTTADTTQFTGKHYGDATPTAPSVTANTGWTFTGWLPVVSSTVTGDVTYVAQYTQNVYTVKYDLGSHGTTSNTTEFTGKHYGDATPAAPAVTANSGWTFTGWLPVVSSTVTGDVTYVAQYTQNVYTVKYDLGSHGTTSNTTEFTGKHYGDATPAAPAVTANAGWSFTGWLPVVSATVTGDVTYVAQYTQNVYTVKYDLGLHGTTVNQTQFSGKHYGDATPSAPVVTAEAGWTFTGWLPTVSLTVTGDVTYVAQYTQNVYTIKFDLGTHGTTTDTIEFPGKHYGDTTPAAPAVTEEAGWTLTGWLPAVSLTVTGDVTYVAQYTQNKYTVKYDLGAHGSTTDTTEFSDLHYGDATPDEPTVNAESGYTFLGWLPTLASTVTGDVTYTAQYNQDEYTVKYDLGTHGSTTDTAEFSSLHYGDTTPTAPVVTEEAGWTFTGWLPVVSGTVKGDVTYTAQYTQNEYSVKYDLGTHGSTSNTTEFTELHYGDTTPSAPVVTEETGWTFTGWLPAVADTVTGDVTYTAQYTQNEYTVKYDLGTHGTTTDTTEFTGRHYGDATPTAPSVTESTGWTFTGWLPVVSPTVKGDVTYTAQYTQNEYKVKYDLGTHGTTADTTEFTDLHYGDATPSAPAVTEEAGWAFTGWLPTVADTVTGDVTYVAQYTQNDYTVKFDIGSHGTTTDTAEFTGKHYGDATPTAPSITEEAGWTFTGWLPTVAATITGDVTYTAQYTQNEYTVKYDLGTHGTTTDTTEFTGKHYGDATPAAPAVTAETGWTFTGWLPVVSATIEGDVTYVAQYTQNEYTVKYDLGTHGTTVDTTEFGGKHYGDATPAAPTVTAGTGWTFTGWLPVVSATVQGDVTYVAQYTQNNYTVKYDLGTHGTTVDTTEFGGKHYGDPTPAAPAVTAETGWTFTGWLPVISATIEGDVTYVAQYTQNDYTVKYDLGTHGTTTDTTVFGGKHYGDPTPAAPQVTAATGWTFTGWLPTVSATVAGDVTYAAQYALKEYTVTFVDADGTTVLGTDTVTHGSGATAPSNPTAPAGYHFTGWDKDYSNVTSELTVKAQYAINTYSVRFFRADGVTQIGATQTINWGGAAVLANAPARTGATFTGWVLTGDNAAVATSLTNVRENIDAVAGYNPDVFVVRFEDFDGTLLGTDEVLYGGDATPPSAPTREGYDFTGWSPRYDNVTGNMTVVAEYTIQTVTVTFVNFDGTVIDTQTVDWNTGATAPEVPQRDGFEFTGWDKSFDPVTSSITVTAQFTEIAAPTPEPTEIPGDEPVPTTGGGSSLFWWLLLIPGLGLLIWLLLAWLSIVPIAEAVTNNGDGTMTIQWGYENRKGRKKKIDDEDSQLTALAGNVIRNSQEPPIEFEKGRVENVFTTVAAVGSKIQWKIKNRKADVDLSKTNK